MISGFVMLSGGAGYARAETVAIAQEYGISYLPLTIIRAQDLLAKAGKAEGIDITTNWLTFTGGAPMNEALISGNLDIASGGVAPMLVLWDRTRGNMDVKALAALGSMPLFLNTSDADVKTIKDFKDSDRIALPAVKVSIQAIILEMAAAQAFGDANYNKLNGLTVSMSHPDGMSSLMNGTAGITAHFTSAPFQYEELANPKIHKVLDSYQVVGGPHTFNVVWASKKFVDGNPKVVKAFMIALQQAMAFIHEHPTEAAKIYIADEKSKSSIESIVNMIKDPQNVWTTKPQRIMEFAKFMQKTGLIKHVPADTADVFFQTSK
ncbi:MAG TPA: ABC transporter substrate-binding protein [Acidocella sp.]|nr:ABC transporter substrate-binding protein [Acidocella sp.]